MNYGKNNMDEMKKQRQAIRKAMEYAVGDNDLAVALDVLMQYREDRVAQDLLLEFYSFLPEAQADYVREIRLVARSRGLFLLAAMTDLSAYMYLVSSEGVEFHGAVDQGYLDAELLQFFDFADLDAFREHCGTGESLPAYEPLQLDVDVCPACHVVTGEFHELGCPLEVCPWCGGQLVRCPCRFEHLEVETMGSEEEIVRFEALLEERGRVAYSPDQRPDFADDGPGVVFE